MVKGDVMKVQCINCTTPTNHVVVEETKVSGEEEGIDWATEYQVIQCRGCDAISFRKVSWSSENFDPYTGEEESIETLYPSRTAGRNPIIGHEEFPGRTRRIYLEVLTALNNGAPVLAAIGLRAI